MATIPTGMSAGQYQLMVKANNGMSMVNGLTFHIIGAGYNPTVFEVDSNLTAPGPNQYTTIQAALEAAATVPQALVVVLPGLPTAFNPLGTYFENVVIHSPVKLQGVGPGGVYADAVPTGVPGSTISGLGFGGDTDLANAWRTLVNDIQQGPGWDGNQTIYEGQVVYVLANDGQFTAGYKAAIDGFTIEGGDQMGFPGNLAQIWGLPNGQQVTAITQGGGIFANAYAHYLQITNNILQSNGGAYGGAIRLAHPTWYRLATLTPMSGFPITALSPMVAPTWLVVWESSLVRIIMKSLITMSAPTSQLNMVVPSASMATVQMAQSMTTGSTSTGLMTRVVAFSLVANCRPILHLLSPGAGPVKIYNNLVQANLSNDDGGGLRLLMAGNFTFSVFNNIIVNNVSTHEGGGIAIDDAPDVRIVNNTIMKNITTATAVTSNGLPAPAGVSTTQNSALLQATLPIGSPIFSKPVLFNNIFADNRAGSSAGAGVSGIGIPGDPSPINLWDMGVRRQFRFVGSNLHFLEYNPRYQHQYDQHPGG